jgi:surfeit locus 1 family protein
MIRLNWKLNLISEIELSLTKSPVELSNNEKKNFLRIKLLVKLIMISKYIYII